MEACHSFKSVLFYSTPPRCWIFWGFKGGAACEEISQRGHHFSLSSGKWDSLADQYCIPSVQWINKCTQRITKGHFYIQCFFFCFFFYAQCPQVKVDTCALISSTHSFCGVTDADGGSRSDMNAARTSTAWAGSELCFNPLPGRSVERRTKQAGLQLWITAQRYAKLFKSINYPFKYGNHTSAHANELSPGLFL